MTAPISAAAFRKELKFRAARLEEVTGVLPDGKPVTATVKVDGELEVWHIDVPAGVVTIINRNENQRHVYPVEVELLNDLKRKGHQSARGAGELYAIRPGRGRRRPLSFEASISQIKTRTKKSTPVREQGQLRLAVFDIFELDGQQLWGEVPYAERFALLYSLFADPGIFVHPVAGQVIKGDVDPVNELWRKHVLEENFEGLVLRLNGAVKVKPIHTLDLAVIAMMEGTGRHAGRMGALVTAFRDPAGRFVYAGKVGTGFTDEEREWWWHSLTRLKGKFTVKRAGTKQQAWETKTHFVAPGFVIEVEAERFIQQQAAAWHWHPRTERWVRYGSQPSAIMQKPRFVRLRDDKGLDPYDLRLGQVPGMESNASLAKIPPIGADGKAFAKLLNDLRPDLEKFASKLRVPAGDFEDVLQDTYIKALQGYRKLEKEGAFRSGAGMPKPGERLNRWLFTIFHNEWTSLQRKRARQVKARRPKGKRQVEQLAEMRARGRALEGARPNPGHKPPKGVKAAAARGLELRRRFGRGGTAVGIARARDLARGAAVSDSTIKRMASFFARHAVDRRPGWSNPSNPSNGYIAWMLWGGDAGRTWANRMKQMLERQKVRA